MFRGYCKPTWLFILGGDFIPLVVLLRSQRITIFSIFPSPAGMSLTKLPLGGNNFYMTSFFPPRESLVSDIPAGTGISKSFFLPYILFLISQSIFSVHLIKLCSYSRQKKECYPRQGSEGDARGQCANAR
jgi:hypothetical protein